MEPSVVARRWLVLAGAGGALIGALVGAAFVAVVLLIPFGRGFRMAMFEEPLLAIGFLVVAAPAFVGFVFIGLVVGCASGAMVGSVIGALNAPLSAAIAWRGRSRLLAVAGPLLSVLFTGALGWAVSGDPVGHPVGTWGTRVLAAVAAVLAGVIGCLVFAERLPAWMPDWASPTARPPAKTPST